MKTLKTLDRVFAAVLFITLAAATLLLWPVTPALAQAPSAFPYSKPYLGDGTTVQYQTACENASGQASLCSASATSHFLGICVSGCGTKGTNWIAFAGQVNVIMDGTTTLQHYVQLSATAGEGHDTGATTWPTSGGDVLGVITQTSSGAGAQSVMELFPPEQQASSAGQTYTYTSRCKQVNQPAVTFSPTANTYVAVVTCTIPANVLNTTNTCLRAEIEAYPSASPTNTDWKWQFGATATGSALLNNSSTSAAHFEAFVCETGTNTQQFETAGCAQQSNGCATTPPVTPAEVTSSPITLTLQGTCNAACATPPQWTPLMVEVDSF